MYNVVLAGNSGEELTLPVTPEKVKISAECEIIKYKNYWKGTVLSKGFMQPRVLKFESIIPAVKSDSDLHIISDVYGFECIEKIEKWRKQRDSIRIIIKEMAIDSRWIIGIFEYEVGKGGIIRFELEATEV